MEKKEEIKKLSHEMKDMLNEPLPKEALKQHPSKKYLTTINPAYVIERMNNVFGVGGWVVKAEVVEATPGDKMIVVHITIAFPEYPTFVVTAFGGNDNPDRGDAYKGAETDAFTKACSKLGIGLHIWKNEPTPTAVKKQIANTKPCPECKDEMKLYKGKEGEPDMYACVDCKKKYKPSDLN